MSMRPAPLVLLTVLLGGCTAAKTLVHLTEAESALRRAEEFEAQELARYEYTMALRYLDKAREEAGYTDYRMSEKLARKSEEWADRAIIFIERGGNQAVDPNDLTPIPERATPAPAPVPAPSTGDDPWLDPTTPMDTPPPAPAPAPEPAPPPEPEPGEEFESQEDDIIWDNQ